MKGTVTVQGASAEGGGGDTGGSDDDAAGGSSADDGLGTESAGGAALPASGLDAGGLALLGLATLALGASAAPPRASRPAVNDRKIRVVVAKPGLDGHDRGAKIIARALRDAGMEVIYTGLHQTPEQIVETVLQEDADAVGLSILSGAHMTLVPRIAALLEEQGADDVVLVVGGTIPGDDIPELKELGVSEVFTPGAPVQGIIDFIRQSVPD